MTRDENGRNCLHNCAILGKWQYFKALLDSPKVDINAIDNLARTPLIQVIIHQDPKNFHLFRPESKGQYECVQALIQRGAKVNLRDKEGRTALHYAITYKRWASFLAIIKCFSDDGLTMGDNSGQTLIHALLDPVDPVNPLKLRSANLGSDETFPLKCLKVLLAKGLDVNAKDLSGRSPLHYAATSHKWDCFQELVNKGAHISDTDSEGATPMHRHIKF